ncbi:MAG: V-type ATP synthase subunit D [Planctomycetes bacterium]|nr:V-type ATP synthase subunit D [Planctomycetota bacterium]
MQHISPTRMNLLLRKAQVTLAQQGADLLKKKRDALSKEFMAEVQFFVDVKTRTLEKLDKAVASLIMSLTVDGTEHVESAGLPCAERDTIDIREKNIWGTKVPEIEIMKKSDTRSLSERGYPITSTSTRIDETAYEFETVVELIITMAPLEIKLKRLGEEIRETSRRVNALEQVLIPELTEQVRFISNALEERTREDVFRLKRLKNKMERGKEL